MEVISWPAGTHNFSQAIPILSGRGLSQVLPDALQAELQHAVIISSGRSGLGDAEPPIEVEPQVDVVTMESESYEQESSTYDDLGEQIPDEEVAVGAMEVTVWSTVDQEGAEDVDMINQSSSNLEEHTFRDDDQNENHTPDLASPPSSSAVVKETTSQSAKVSLEAGNRAEHVILDNSVEISTVTGGQEVKTAMSEEPFTLPPLSLASPAKPTDKLEASLNVRHHRGRKKVIVIPRELDTALDSFSQDEVSAVRKDDVETVKEVELPGVQKDDVIVTGNDVGKEDAGSRRKGKLPLSKKNGVFPVRKRAVVVPRGMDGSLEFFSQDEVGVRQEPLPQVKQLPEVVVVVSEKEMEIGAPLSSTQLSTQSSQQSSKSLFSSYELPAPSASPPADPLPIHSATTSSSLSVPLPDSQVSLPNLQVSLPNPRANPQASLPNPQISLPNPPTSTASPDPPLLSRPATTSTLREQTSSYKVPPVEVSLHPASLPEDDFLYQTDSEGVCSDLEVRLESPSSSQHVEEVGQEEVGQGETSREETELEYPYPVSSLHSGKDNALSPHLTSPTTKPHPSATPMDTIVPPSPSVDISPLVLPSPLPILLSPFLSKPAVFRELVSSAGWGKVSNHRERTTTSPAISPPNAEERERDSTRSGLAVSCQELSSPSRNSEKVVGGASDAVVVVTEGEGGTKDPGRGVVSVEKATDTTVIAEQGSREAGTGGGVVNGVEEDVADNGEVMINVVEEGVADSGEGVVDMVEEGVADSGGVMVEEVEGREAVTVEEEVCTEGVVAICGEEIIGTPQVDAGRGVVGVEASQEDQHTAQEISMEESRWEEYLERGAAKLPGKEAIPAVDSVGGTEGTPEDLPNTLIVDVMGSQSPIWGQVEQVVDTHVQPRGESCVLHEVVGL